MSWQEPGATLQVCPVTDGERGRMLASDADRDCVTGTLATACGEGRLSRDEYDTRLDATLFARTFADLDELVNDLPEAPPAPWWARWRRPPLGSMARSRVKRTRSRGLASHPQD